MKKIIMWALISIAVLILIAASYLFLGKAKPAENISWGAVFSQKHAQLLGLDWQESYLALLDDLGVRRMKVASYWDYIEKSDGEYDFNDLDWQVAEAAERDAKILLAIGMKTPRWPECHIPDWAAGLSKEDQQQEILDLLKEIVARYDDSDAIWGWQVENEPFFPFGVCPWVDEDFLKEEVELVKSLDSKDRPVVVTESGEFPLWIMAAKYGDVVGVTMYKKVWVHQINRYITYPFPSVFYHRKAEIVRKVFGKEVIGVELQAEPWGPKLLYDSPLEEQEKTMNLNQFKYNIEFAKNTGISEFYLWGAEWWYWMKEKQNDSAIWEESRKLF
ncbi:MAG: hypothetical protein WC919_01225 [Candidatus Paceibacterota bacterium]|jgi:hypothetical protein